jgi:Pentapeptide repeats (8 copies)/GYF domain 2
MRKTWYLRRQGRQVGPFTSGAVRRLLLQGQVTLEDEVSADRRAWERVGAVAEVVPPELRAGGRSVVVAPPRAPVPWIAIGLSLLVVAGSIGFGVWWGGDGQGQTPSCSRAPAPGVDWHNCRFSALKAPSADLHGANLRNAELAGAALPGVDLSGARLDYASLRQADLGYGVLRRAVLRGADLRGADLGHADLSGADLGFADLTGAKVAGVNLAGTHLDHALWVDGTTCAADSLGGCTPAGRR